MRSEQYRELESSRVQHFQVWRRQRLSRKICKTRCSEYWPQHFHLRHNQIARPRWDPAMTEPDAEPSTSSAADNKFDLGNGVIGDSARNGTAQSKNLPESNEPDTSASNGQRRDTSSKSPQRSLSSHEIKSEPAAKRTRRGGDADSAGRGRRLFGLLNQTLSKAKEDNVRRTSGEAGRRRAEVEARLQQRVKHDSAKMQKSKELTTQLETQLNEAFSLAIEIQSMEMAVRLRKAQKRRLGSFLVTPSDLAVYDGEPGESSNRGWDSSLPPSVDGRVLAPAIASVIAPVGREHSSSMQAPDAHPVYFLPAKMLATQDDQLDDQEDSVDEAIFAADDAWTKRREGMQERLGDLQAAIRRIRDEIDVLEGRNSNEQAKARDKSPERDSEMQ